MSDGPSDAWRQEKETKQALEEVPAIWLRDELKRRDNESQRSQLLIDIKKYTADILALTAKRDKLEKLLSKFI